MSDFVSDYLADIDPGSRVALDGIMPQIYAELRRLAVLYMSGERTGHTLQPTALVHEAYLRLARQSNLQWTSRAHILALAARTMRRILIDHAAAHNAAKRCGTLAQVSLDDVSGAANPAAFDFLDIDRALVTLAEFDARKAAVIELRFFGGLEVAEIAEVLGISPATVHREWAAARLWLIRFLEEPKVP